MSNNQTYKNLNYITLNIKTVNQICFQNSILLDFYLIVKVSLNIQGGDKIIEPGNFHFFSISAYIYSITTYFNEKKIILICRG